MKFAKFLFLLTLPVYFFSCKSVQRLPYYLQDVNDSTTFNAIKIPELRIQKNDQLSIQIFSISTDPKVDEIYNQPMTGANNGGGGGGGAGQMAMQGYLVDINGNIKHHRLGLIHAEGLTKEELAEEVKKRLSAPVELLKDPTVVVNFLNLRVTLLGQINSQGALNFPGERLSIIEAIGLAGGVTDFGTRDNVRVIREVNGKRETGVIDLTSKKLYDSPFFYLAQNDLILVGETDQRIGDIERQRITQQIAFAFTIVTVVATLANIFIK